jgi:hypothetical protein
MITSMDAEKAYDKIQHPFMIKKIRHKWIIPQDKAIYEKPKATSH